MPIHCQENSRLVSIIFRALPIVVARASVDGVVDDGVHYHQVKVRAGPARSVLAQVVDFFVRSQVPPVRALHLTVHVRTVRHLIAQRSTALDAQVALGGERHAF